MTGPNAGAALPGRRRLALEATIDQPGQRRPLACPNCNGTDTLVLIEEATIERPIFGAWNVETTDPEVDVDDVDTADVLPTQPTKIVGVRCEHCRWGYQGERPLDRLVYAR